MARVVALLATILLSIQSWSSARELRLGDTLGVNHTQFLFDGAPCYAVEFPGRDLWDRSERWLAATECGSGGPSYAGTADAGRPPVAVAMAGQLRTLNETADNWANELFGRIPQGVNVFMFVSVEEEFFSDHHHRGMYNRHALEGFKRAIGKLRPRQLVLYTQADYGRDSQAPVRTPCKGGAAWVKNSAVQFWTVERAYDLVRAFENRHGMQHSFVMRLRPDTGAGPVNGGAVRRIVTSSAWSASPMVWSVGEAKGLSHVSSLYLANAAAAQAGALQQWNSSFDQCDTPGFHAWDPPLLPSISKACENYMGSSSKRFPSFHCMLSFFWRSRNMSVLSDSCLKFAMVRPHSWNPNKAANRTELLNTRGERANATSLQSSLCQRLGADGKPEEERL